MGRRRGRRERGVKLTDQQRAIVDADGNFLLLACPGSGKTRSAAERVAHLTATPGPKVAVCSYTNVGADRLGAVLRNDLRVILGPEHFLGTIHAFLIRYVLAPFGHLFGGDAHPVIRVDDDWPDLPVLRGPQAASQTRPFPPCTRRLACAPGGPARCAGHARGSHRLRRHPRPRLQEEPVPQARPANGRRRHVGHDEDPAAQARHRALRGIALRRASPRRGPGHLRAPARVPEDPARHAVACARWSWSATSSSRSSPSRAPAPRAAATWPKDAG